MKKEIKSKFCKINNNKIQNEVCNSCQIYKGEDCDYLNSEIASLVLQNNNNEIDKIFQTTCYIPEECPYKLEQIVINEKEL